MAALSMILGIMVTGNERLVAWYYNQGLIVRRAVIAAGIAVACLLLYKIFEGVDIFAAVGLI